MSIIKTSMLPVIIAILSAALFGIATPFSKLLLNDMNPFSLAGLLYLGASIGLFPVVLARKELSSISTLNRKNIRRLLGAIILGGIIGPIFLLFGLKSASASSVSLWLNLELVATTVLGFLFFKDYLGNKGWIGVIIALTSGVLLTINEGDPGIMSVMLVSLACICWGFDNHFTALIDGISAVQSTFLKGIFAGIINFGIGVFIFKASLTISSIIYAVVLGSISYGISIVLYIISAQKIGAIRSQIIFSSAPFFGVFFAVVFLSESITPLQLISFVLLIFSISLFAHEKHEHHHEHDELEHTHFHDHNDLHHDHVHNSEISQHEHVHIHKKGFHSHPHWPDIHHRHDHE
jgi:drug/metabolite transporter (DMT)-like permease